MIEWLALVISVIAILLEKEKLSRLFLDFSGWVSRKKYEIEGKQFVNNITSADRHNGLRIVFTTLFFFYLLSSALSGLLKVDTTEKLGFVSAITLSPFLLLVLRGVFRQYKQKQLSLLFLFGISFTYVLAIWGMGLLWGIITTGFLSLKFSVFWAGLLATPCTLGVMWLAQYHSSKTWAKNL